MCFLLLSLVTCPDADHSQESRHELDPCGPSSQRRVGVRSSGGSPCNCFCASRLTRLLLLVLQYVALSRVVSLQGLSLSGPALSAQGVKAHPDVLRFYRALLSSAASNSTTKRRKVSSPQPLSQAMGQAFVAPSPGSSMLPDSPGGGDSEGSTMSAVWKVQEGSRHLPISLVDSDDDDVQTRERLWLELRAPYQSILGGVSLMEFQNLSEMALDSFISTAGVPLSKRGKFRMLHKG